MSISSTIKSIQEGLLVQMSDGLPLVDNWDEMLPAGKEL